MHMHILGFLLFESPFKVFFLPISCVQVFKTLFFVFSCLAAAIQIELHFRIFLASESDVLIFLKGIEMLVFFAAITAIVWPLLLTRL